MQSIQSPNKTPPKNTIRTQVPIDIYQTRYIPQHIQHLGGEHQGRGLGRIRIPSIEFTDDFVLWETRDDESVVLRVTSYTDVDAPST